MIGSVASSIANPWDYGKACYRHVEPTTVDSELTGIFGIPREGCCESSESILVYDLKTLWDICFGRTYP